MLRIILISMCDTLNNFLYYITLLFHSAPNLVLLDGLRMMQHSYWEIATLGKAGCLGFPFLSKLEISVKLQPCTYNI